MKRKVVTLDQQALADASAALAANVSEICAPDLVVGILNGGKFVAETMFADVPHCYVELRRPSTASKSGTLARFVKAMPRRLQNMARIAESWWLERRSRHLPPAVVALDSDVLRAVSNARHILLVDDAVDSGRTMLAVSEAIKNAMVKDAVLTHAALTVTTKFPSIEPDIVVFPRFTLLRFPWSTDF